MVGGGKRSTTTRMAGRLVNESGWGRIKTCTVEGCSIPISYSQEFCARCWNNVPRRYQVDYKTAAASLQQAEINMKSAILVIRTHAAVKLSG